MTMKLPGPMNDGMVNGFRVLCYAPWIPAGGGLRGPRTVIVVDRGPEYENRERYVVSGYVAGDHEWLGGHYMQSFEEAVLEFADRLKHY